MNRHYLDGTRYETSKGAMCDVAVYPPEEGKGGRVWRVTVQATNEQRTFRGRWARRNAMRMVKDRLGPDWGAYITGFDELGLVP